MTAQAFYNPKTLAGLLDVLDGGEAVIVNGGTDIVERLSGGALKPRAIAYIRNVAELDYIREDNGHVAIGGIASYKSMLESPLCRAFAGLREAVSQIGSPPIRAVATPAGNIGTAAPAADCNVALLALGASLALCRKKGERVISLEELFAKDGKQLIEPDELIREIRIPINKAASSAFVRLTKRKAQDIAQVSACVNLEASGGVCRNVRVAMGAVARRAVRAASLEAMIENKSPNEAIAAIKGFIPPEAALRSPVNKPYKEAVISVIVGRALKKAYAGIAG